MDRALVVGGTRFIGRHLVEELLEADYAVTLFNRGDHENPFAGDDRVDHVAGDRTDEATVERVGETLDPEVVFDVVAYHPKAVAHATRVFGDVEAYVYVSSGAAYAAEAIPKREDETPIRNCTPRQAVDDGPETYGNRKAEGDREVRRAADRGVRAMAVRPPIVYGPYDYTERLDYWLDRIARHDRIVVPGDGTNVWQRAYVEDVARGLRIVAERGTAGEWYNVGDRNAVTIDRMIELIADAMDERVEVVHASDRELSVADLESTAFPLYRRHPHLLDTAKLASLGWDSTPVETAMEQTAAEHLDSDRNGRHNGPPRATEERLLEVLGTV
ncbi:MAG: NAD-dependent epimerase/dehydratase family protein [Halodesulfurarchaeum sp.]